MKTASAMQVNSYGVSNRSPIALLRDCDTWGTVQHLLQQYFQHRIRISCFLCFCEKSREFLMGQISQLFLPSNSRFCEVFIQDCQSYYFYSNFRKLLYTIMHDICKNPIFEYLHIWETLKSSDFPILQHNPGEVWFPFYRHIFVRIKTTRSNILSS